MFLIDKPYVSPFLIKTIRDNNYKIVATKTAKTLIGDDSLNWISEEKTITESQTTHHEELEEILVSDLQEYIQVKV